MCKDSSARAESSTAMRGNYCSFCFFDGRGTFSIETFQRFWNVRSNDVWKIRMIVGTRCDAFVYQLGNFLVVRGQRIRQMELSWVHLIVAIELVWNTSLIKAKRFLFLISSGSVILEQRWNKDRESTTTSVIFPSMISSSKCLKHVGLSTASAAASRSAVLVLRSTLRAGIDTHQSACTPFLLRLKMVILSRTLDLPWVVCIQASDMASSLNDGSLVGMYMVTDEQLLMLLRTALRACSLCSLRSRHFVAACKAWNEIAGLTKRHM